MESISVESTLDSKVLQTSLGTISVQKMVLFGWIHILMGLTGMLAYHWQYFWSLVVNFDSVNLGILPFFLALNEQLARLMAPPSSFPKKTTKVKCKRLSLYENGLVSTQKNNNFYL